MSPLTLAFAVASATLLALCAYKLLLADGLGLLSGSVGGAAQPERVAALVCSLVAAVAYVSQALGQPLAHNAAGLPTLPEPADWILWLAGGGHAAYLLGKAQRSVP